MMMMLIIIIMVLEGVNRDFCNLLTALVTVSNSNTQMARVQLCASHVLHIEHLSRVTCHVPRDMTEGTARLLNFTERKSILFFSFILLAETIKLLLLDDRVNDNICQEST